jgi:four helix bundle protein
LKKLEFRKQKTRRIKISYREANRVESRNDFAHKIAIVQKEASETQYWMELYCAVEIGNKQKRDILMQESTELLAIFTSIGKSLKENNSK